MIHTFFFVTLNFDLFLGIYKKNVFVIRVLIKLMMFLDNLHSVFFRF